MKVLVPQHSGFCPGVAYAQNALFRVKKRHTLPEPLYVFGKLIHNRDYIDYLASEGIATLDASKLPDSLPNGSTIFIRTHGIARNIEQKLRSRFNIVDLTCRKVKDLQKLIEDYSNRGYFIAISGKPGHPEVQGLVSYALHSAVFETPFITEAFSEAARDFGNILIVSQTTAPLANFSALVEEIQKKWGNEKKIEPVNTICNITSKREQKTLEMISEADIVFVIGDRQSSNANKLFEAISKAHSCVYFIENKSELVSLPIELREYQCAVVVSSSSTPAYIETEIVNTLESIQPIRK